MSSTLWIVALLLAFFVPILTAGLERRRRSAEERARLRVEPVDEWIVSLDGRDLALVRDRELTDMFWHSFRAVPFTPEDLAVLSSTDYWSATRFSFRHQTSGRVVRAFGGPVRGEQPSDGSLRVVLRGLH